MKQKNTENTTRTVGRSFPTLRRTSCTVCVVCFDGVFRVVLSAVAFCADSLLVSSLTRIKFESDAGTSDDDATRCRRCRRFPPWGPAPAGAEVLGWFLDGGDEAAGLAGAAAADDPLLVVSCRRASSDRQSLPFRKFHSPYNLFHPPPPTVVFAVAVPVLVGWWCRTAGCRPPGSTRPCPTPTRPCFRYVTCVPPPLVRARARQGGRWTVLFPFVGFVFAAPDAKVSECFVPESRERRFCEGGEECRINGYRSHRGQRTLAAVRPCF